MAGAKRRTVLDWFRRAKDAKTDAEMENLASEAEKEMGHDEEPEGAEHTHVHVHAGEPGMADHAVTRDEFGAHVEKNDTEHKAFDERLNALETHMKAGDAEEATEKELKEEFEEEAPEGTGDDAIKGAKDSVIIEPTYQATLAAANILAPGIRPARVYDRAKKPGAGINTICQLRKDALTLAAATPEMHGIIRNLNGGKAFDSAKATCSAARALFRGAVEAKKALNNAGTNGRATDAQTVKSVGITSVADWQKANDDFYKGAH